MKITQDQAEFKPITIVIETREEAETVLNIIDSFPADKMTLNVRNMLINISNWFSNEGAV